MRTRRRWGRELSSRQRQLSLDPEMKWRLPGRGSGTGTYGRTLNLLSSDPCPAAVPRTLRAGRAPGTDRAPSGCSSASPPPPRLQLRPKGLHSFCLRRLEVFAQVCRQNSRLGSQRFPFRASQYAGNGGGGGGFSCHTADSGGCSCSSALPRDGESRRRCSPPPDPGGVPSPPHRGSLTSTFQEGVASQQLQARDWWRGPRSP